MNDSTLKNVLLKINWKNWLPWFIKTEQLNKNWNIITSAKLKIEKDWLIKIYLPTLFDQKIDWKSIIKDASLFMHIDKSKIN